MTAGGDEKAFLLRSIADLDREHDAGDLSDEDHAALRAGYVARTAVLLREQDEDKADEDADPSTVARPPRRRRRGLLVGGVSVIVTGAVVWAVVQALAPRLPGETVTGSVVSPAAHTAQVLARAESDEARGDAAGAVTLYEQVLASDPDQEEALAEAGWLEYQAGARARQAKLLSLGQAQEQQAVALEPGDAAPHLYLGSMLLADGKAADAVTQYRAFLADDPPEAQVRAAARFIATAFADAHETPPALPTGAAAS